MAFFNSKPKIRLNEKARIEFELQQLSEAVGAKRFQLPIVRLSRWQDLIQRPLSEVLQFTGKHIGHNTHDVRLDVQPENLEKCGGGG